MVDCADQEPDRQVSYSYNDGSLVGVPGYASELPYHAKGALASVQHANGLTGPMGLDAN